MNYRVQISHGSSYGQTDQILNFFEKQNGRQKTKWPPNRKIEHNSLISWATESRFGMEVRRNSLNKFWQNLEKQNGCQKTKWPPNHKIKLIWTGASAILTCEIFLIYLYIYIYTCWWICQIHLYVLCKIIHDCNLRTIQMYA